MSALALFSLISGAGAAPAPEAFYVPDIQIPNQQANAIQQEVNTTVVSVPTAANGTDVATGTAPAETTGRRGRKCRPKHTGGAQGSATPSAPSEAPSAPSGTQGTAVGTGIPVTQGTAVGTGAPVTLPSGTDAAPTDAAPTDAAPTDAAPTDAAPTDAAPTDAAPTDAAPTDAAPTDAAPTAPVAATDAPAGGAPSSQTTPVGSPEKPDQPQAEAPAPTANGAAGNNSQFNGWPADPSKYHNTANFATPLPKVNEQETVTPEGSAGPNPEKITADDPLAKLLVERHNQWRALYGLDAVFWNESLAAVAIKNSKSCDMIHRLAPDQGVWAESIMSWLGPNLPWTVQKSVDSWASEGKYWDEATQAANPPGSVIGHFSNIVDWRFKAIGCGWHADCPNAPGDYFGLYCEYGYGDEPYPFGVPGKPVKAVTKIDWASFD